MGNDPTRPNHISGTRKNELSAHRIASPLLLMAVKTLRLASTEEKFSAA
jgi:hypothetical protein